MEAEPKGNLRKSPTIILHDIILDELFLKKEKKNIYFSGHFFTSKMPLIIGDVLGRHMAIVFLPSRSTSAITIL